ncbi:MAG: ribulose-phosphate 3-epimerase [candidate division WOR-3 bacterium]|nr:ribulose-phosphate 3-epimerase [candidate division WOR-3 bacterium]MDW7987672.1 ribulose-phosphate 3-epimerase [candidate division WOR-3 bacterium]
MKIAASILNCNFLKLAEELKKVQACGIDAIHLDVMDGHFVPNLSFGVPILKAIRPIVKVPIYTHLMVFYPEKMINSFIEDSDGVIFHYEATKKHNECIRMIKEQGKFTGMALNPKTPIDIVDKYLKYLDEVLIMSVQPGFGGQKFISQSLDRIRRLKELINQRNSKTLIGVDGGISPENACMVKDAGADILVAGTAIFHSTNYKQTVKKLKCLTL